ncbi:hypothetical protein JW916_04435, partial [Candidatus Sumerlaeota bacterium]|nr:hypothetical protein [Candidatus Sumerlaeota bacterium]
SWNSNSPAATTTGTKSGNWTTLPNQDAPERLDSAQRPVARVFEGRAGFSFTLPAGSGTD